MHIGHKLGLNGVTKVALAKQCTRGCILRCGVTALYHEVLYHTVEKQRVIPMLLYQPYEIVAVPWRLVIKAQVYNAGCGVHAHRHILWRATGYKQKNRHCV